MLYISIFLNVSSHTCNEIFEEKINIKWHVDILTWESRKDFIFFCKNIHDLIQAFFYNQFLSMKLYHNIYWNSIIAKKYLTYVFVNEKKRDLSQILVKVIFFLLYILLYVRNTRDAQRSVSRGVGWESEKLCVKIFTGGGSSVVSENSILRIVSRKRNFGLMIYFSFFVLSDCWCQLSLKDEKKLTNFYFQFWPIRWWWMSEVFFMMNNLPKRFKRIHTMCCGWKIWNFYILLLRETLVRSYKKKKLNVAKTLRIIEFSASQNYSR